MVKLDVKNDGKEVFTSKRSFSSILVEIIYIYIHTFSERVEEDLFWCLERTCTEETCVPALCPMVLVSIPWVEQSNGRGRAGGAAQVVGHRLKELSYNRGSNMATVLGSYVWPARPLR